MKTETFTCDICDFKNDGSKMYDAYILIGRSQRMEFHVCSTCWVESPKGVFQKAFNKFCIMMGKKK